MRIEIKELEGKDHYVVPIVMIVEGILNGSGGALFYPSDEIKKSARHWNGRPIVVYHPDLYSDGIAGNPTVFNKQKVGTIFNAKFNNKSLKAEAWLDIERLKKVDKRILNSIHNREIVEVSTGLFLDKEDVSGTFSSKRYDAIARNYRPDHLAILPDLIGACSVADGAGLCRNVKIDEELLRIPAMKF